MLFGTVRRKLTALVAFSALAALVVLPILWWLMHRELIDEIDDRVPDALQGFQEELDDDLKDLDVTARALAEQGDIERALAARDGAALGKLAGPFRDAYPDLDIIFYDVGGRMVAQVGCASPQVVMPKLPAGHAVMPHGCEADERAPLAIGTVRTAGAAGFVLVCLPLDTNYFANAQHKLGLELALTPPGAVTSVLYATPKFPVAYFGRAGQKSGDVIDVDGRTWAIGFDKPAGLADAPRFAVALDVTAIKSIVRKHLSFALAIVVLATVISISIGWRLATRMGSALARVSRAMRRLEQQEYVKVDAVKTGDELEDLATGFNAMVDGLRERDKLKTTMGKYHTEEVLAHVMAGAVELGGESLEVTILFCDLRDFTTLSEKRTAHEIVEILNEYFTVMVDIVMDERGAVDKYIGDNIMAVFGAPVSRPDDAIRAVRAAVRMRDALAALNAKHPGRPPLRFGIGLHTGEVVAGNIGSQRRMEYTVIGDAVNLASRLESKTKELATDILISDATFAKAGAINVEAAGALHVKGREQPVQTYKVLGLTPSA
jgi:adenylate cyclase